MNGFVLALGIAAVAVAGCDKDKKKAGEEGAGGEGAAAAGGEGAARPAVAGGAGSALAYMPKDAQVVAGLDFGSLRKTKLWEQMMPMVKQSAGAELNEFSTACGIDPFTAIESITIGGNADDDENMVVAIKAGTDKAKIIECAKKMAEKEQQELTVTEEGDLVKFSDGTETMWVAFKGGMIVTGPKAEGDGGKAWLEGVLAGKENVTGNADMMSLIKDTDTSAGIWFAMIPPADDPSMAGFPGGPPKKMAGSISFKDGLHVNAGLHYADAAGAKAVSDQVTGMVGPMSSDPQMGKYVQKLKVTPEGSVARFKLDLNQAEFDELMAQIQQQLPMLMMMAGGGGM